MTDLKAQVRKGRLVLNVATDLPEGTEVDLVPADWWDDLDDESRRLPDNALRRSEADVRAKRLYPLDVILSRLRKQA